MLIQSKIQHPIRQCLSPSLTSSPVRLYRYEI